MIDDPLDLPVPPARHPFQVWIMAGGVISGIALVLTGPTQNSLEELLPAWGRVAWALTLAVGGALCLAGAWWREPVYALLLERAGMAGLAGAYFGYGGAIGVVGLSNDQFARGLAAGTLVITLGMAATQRVRQITRALRRLEHMRPGPQARP